MLELIIWNVCMKNRQHDVNTVNIVKKWCVFTDVFVSSVSTKTTNLIIALLNKIIWALEKIFKINKIFQLYCNKDSVCGLVWREIDWKI